MGCRIGLSAAHLDLVWSAAASPLKWLAVSRTVPGSGAIDRFNILE
jgi:hypothetical protein